MSKTDRRQMRLTIPVNKSELTSAAKMASAGVDGAKSSADLVRRLLADRFARYIAESANRADVTGDISGASKSGRSTLTRGTHSRPGVPTRKGRPRHPAGKSTKGRGPKNLAKPGLVGILPGQSAGERTGAPAQ